MNYFRYKGVRIRLRKVTDSVDREDLSMIESSSILKRFNLRSNILDFLMGLFMVEALVGLSLMILRYKGVTYNILDFSEFIVWSMVATGVLLVLFISLYERMASSRGHDYHWYTLEYAGMTEDIILLNDDKEEEDLKSYAEEFASRVEGYRDFAEKFHRNLD